jgi:excisionase family DNA binding protein
MEQLYTPQEVADMLQFSRLTVYNWIKSGKLKACRVSRRMLRIKKEDLDDFIERHRYQADPAAQ